MSRATAIDLSQSLAHFADGEGAQFFDGEPPIAGVPRYAATAERAPDIQEASLDFVIAGPEWWASDNPVTLLRTWRHALKYGGRLVVLVDTQDTNLAVAQRLVALECGVACEAPQALQGSVSLLSGRRSVEDGLRRGFSLIANEIGRADRPASWRGEFYFDLGTVLLQAGEGRRSAECFRITLESDENNLEARIGLAMALSLSSDLEESQSLLRDVLATDPDNSLAAVWLQRCRERAAETQSNPAILTPAARRTR